MAVGYFLVIGDKTSCGGRITSGCDNHTFYGRATAREGDSYICGADNKIYRIAGGIPNYIIHGAHAAGTLHSRGTCSCRCRFIPSNWNDTYEYESESKLTAKPLSATPKPPAPAPTPVPPVVPKEEQRVTVDAGFCVLPYGATPSSYEPWFFINPESNVLSLYHELNPDKVKKPGSILIIADPLKKETSQIEHLKIARDKVDKALEPLTNDEALFLYKHRNVIDTFTSIGGDYGGLIAGMAKDYFSEIEKTLVEIHSTYQNQFLTQGTLISKQFFVERNQLFKKLDSIFLRMFRKRIGLAQYDDIKKALRLSSSSIMHKWNETGINDIEGYATYIEKSSKIVKMMDGLGKVGIGLSALNGANNIYDACTTGIDCSKTTFSEIGKFAGGIALPSFTGRAIIAGSTALCAVVLGAASAPIGGGAALACEVIVAGISGFAVGKAGEAIGSKIGERFYNITN